MTDEERDAQYEVVFSGADELIPARLTKSLVTWQAPEKRIYNKRNRTYWEGRKKKDGTDCSSDQ